MAGIYSVENPVFVSFVVNGAVLLLKMLAVVVCTVYYRMTKNVLVNPEDVKVHDPSGKKGLKIIMDDPDVERTRRAHLNDMENVYLFLFLGLFYITTNPVASTAIMLFRAFTVARVLHSIFYISGVRQPARGLCFFVNVIVNVYMAVSIIHYHM